MGLGSPSACVKAGGSSNEIEQATKVASSNSWPRIHCSQKVSNIEQTAQKIIVLCCREMKWCKATKMPSARGSSRAPILRGSKCYPTVTQAYARPPLSRSGSPIARSMMARSIQSAGAAFSQSPALGVIAR